MRDTKCRACGNYDILAEIDRLMQGDITKETHKRIRSLQREYEKLPTEDFRKRCEIDVDITERIINFLVKQHVELELSRFRRGIAGFAYRFSSKMIEPDYLWNIDPQEYYSIFGTDDEYDWFKMKALQINSPDRYIHQGFAENSYRGGLTAAFHRGLRHALHLDIRSAYNWVQANKKLPYKWIERKEEISLDDLKEILARGKMVTIDADVDVPNGIIAPFLYYDENVGSPTYHKLFAPSGQFRTLINSNEIWNHDSASPITYAWNCIKHIYVCDVYECDFILSKFGKHVLTERKRFEGMCMNQECGAICEAIDDIGTLPSVCPKCGSDEIGDKPMALFMKLIGNSNSGKYGERVHNQRHTFTQFIQKNRKMFSAEEISHLEQFAELQRHARHPYYSMNEHTPYTPYTIIRANGTRLKLKFWFYATDTYCELSDHEDSGNPQRLVSVISFITSYIRSHLTQMLMMIGNLAYYVDTDSIFCASEAYEILRPYIKNDWGYLKLEDEGDYIFVRKKFYFCIRRRLFKKDKEGNYKTEGDFSRVNPLETKKISSGTVKRIDRNSRIRLGDQILRELEEIQSRKWQGKIPVRTLRYGTFKETTHNKIREEEIDLSLDDNTRSWDDKGESVALYLTKDTDRRLKLEIVPQIVK